MTTATLWRLSKQRNLRLVVPVPYRPCNRHQLQHRPPFLPNPPPLPTAATRSRNSSEKVAKSRVYLAQDTLLDREVAFALIKTEGLDEVSRTRITREAQAMGRLGSHLHIVTEDKKPSHTWSQS